MRINKRLRISSCMSHCTVATNCSVITMGIRLAEQIASGPAITVIHYQVMTVTLRNSEAVPRDFC